MAKARPNTSERHIREMRDVTTISTTDVVTDVEMFLGKVDALGHSVLGLPHYQANPQPTEAESDILLETAIICPMTAAQLGHEAGHLACEI